MTTPAQQAELEKPKVNCAWFLELQFASSTLRLCSYGQTFNWGGFDWLGLGNIASISPLEESAGVGSAAMTFGLNIASSDLRALSVGPVEDYRGRPAILYFCPLTEDGVLIDTPERCWTGRMDVISTGIDKEAGQIVLKCETSAFGLKRSSLRQNAAQQKQRYPADTGFDYLNDLLSNPKVWLSKKFQQI